MKILLIGKNSFVGGMLIERFERDGRHEVVGLGSKDCDVRNSGWVERVILNHLPGRSQEGSLPYVVISSFCFKGIANCALNKSDAYQINSVGALNVASACSKHKVRHIFLSSDIAFSGKSEASCSLELGPRTTFGKSKWMGENYVRALGGMVVRTARVYGWSKKDSLFKLVYDSLRGGKEVELYNNLSDHPTYVGDLYKAILEILIVDGRFVLGELLNVVGRSFCSRYGFGKEIAYVFGFPPDLIKPKVFDRRVEFDKCGEAYPEELDIAPSLGAFPWIRRLIEGLEALRRAEE